MDPGPPVLTRAEVRAADEFAARVLGLPTACLMENAGRGLSSVTLAEARRYDIGSVTIVAGRGNNGGDGLVAARHLLLRGMAVRVVLASTADGFSPESDPGVQLRTVRALGIPVHDAATPEGLRAERSRLGPRDLVVDAVLGTGLQGAVHGHLEAVLEWLGTCGRPVVAADLPSGLDADTGEALGPVPRCVATATFLARKPGLLRGVGPARAGRITVCDIGVPPGAVRGRR